MSDDDALTRANRFLTVRKSTEVARIDDGDIDALLKEVEQSTRPKPVATKPPQAAPAPKPASEPVRNLPAVAAPSSPSVAVQSQTPGVTAEVLPPARPAPTHDSGHATQNITVVVNTPAPVVAPYPWWGGWWGYPYYPAVCRACHECPRPCGRWRCPY